MRLHWRGSGEKHHYVYRLDSDRWQEIIIVLAQRQALRAINKQKDFEEKEGSPDQ